MDSEVKPFAGRSPAVRKPMLSSAGPAPSGLCSAPEGAACGWWHLLGDWDLFISETRGLTPVGLSP